MKRSSIPLGTEVQFTTTTGRSATGRVIEVLIEKRPPSIVLIERPDGGRAFRYETEINILTPPLAAAG